ncbi:MAG: cellobionic acid phosphorylase, partial [Clostridiales bacterium]|nr:cellobionic acid phosphorylase [Clostridiales bacterium]
MIKATSDNEYYELNSPTAMPKASGFLWNEKMMIQTTCRGYAVAQFMQPEPAKYSHAPNIEAKTFIQPEQPYYAHHPGRFVYIKDETNGNVFSAPYEPTRIALDTFIFSVGKSNIKWYAKKDGICVEMCLSLPKDDALELWKIKVINKSQEKRYISIYPSFTVGYMSWMNQEGEYNAALNAIVCSSITPYQKYKDYFTMKEFKDKTFLLAHKEPTAWEVNQESFEGEGGIACPSAIMKDKLANGDARYEMPICAFQYKIEAEPGEEREFRFIFGPAKNEKEISNIREKYFIRHNENGEDGFTLAIKEYAKYISEGRSCIQIKTEDENLDNFVNHWLPRQMYYHGISNRLSLDPQTRNYLQDNMGMTYINPETTRNAFLLALAQQ